MIGDIGRELKGHRSPNRFAGETPIGATAMSLHHVYLSDLATFSGASTVEIGGEEAHHAVRVKRLEVGDSLVLIDGKGRKLEGPIAAIDKEKRSGQWKISVSAAAGISVEARAEPEIVVFASAPKGDRLDEMIDGLSQVGVARWHPLMTKRTVVDPRPTKLDRLQRIAMEAMKQCGRTWVLEIGEATAISRVTRGARTVVADGTGQGKIGPIPGAGTLSLLIGPEGGFAPEELEGLRAGGCQIVKFGTHIMRVETAAVVAAAMVGSSASAG